VQIISQNDLELNEPQEAPLVCNLHTEHVSNDDSDPRGNLTKHVSLE
jgi:hypothetical protein